MVEKYLNFQYFKLPKKMCYKKYRKKLNGMTLPFGVREKQGRIKQDDPCLQKKIIFQTFFKQNDFQNMKI